MSFAPLIRGLLSSALLAATVAQVASAAAFPQHEPAPPGRIQISQRVERGRQFGRGGFGGGVREDTPLVQQFDRDGDGRLSSTERRAAFDYAESSGFGRGRGRGG